MSSTGAAMDVLDLLGAEHAAIERLFDATGGASTDEGRAGLALRLCRALTVHAASEEELLYPAAAGVLSDAQLVLRAEVEHAGIKEIVRRLEQLPPSDRRFAASLKVLEERVCHHFQEEERRLFTRLKASTLDLPALGERIARRRVQLARALGTPVEPLEAWPRAPRCRPADGRTPLPRRETSQPRPRIPR